MMCFSVLSDCAATRVSSIERSSHSEATKRITSRSLICTISGASSIDSTSAATATCASPCGISFTSRICDSSTKPNSPPAHSHNPERIAVPGGDPNSREAANTMPNFSTSSAASMPSTAGRLRRISITSSNMPTVTKNSPSSTSRKGLMSSSTW